jgi:ABC-type transporter Mla subunit MlaD
MKVGAEGSEISEMTRGFQQPGNIPENVADAFGQLMKISDEISKTMLKIAFQGEQLSDVASQIQMTFDQGDVVTARFSAAGSALVAALRRYASELQD